MKPNSTPALTIDGGPLPVNAEQIERRLNQIWQEAAADKLEGTPATKLCLANVLIITDMESRREAELLTAELAAAHPSRVFMIAIDDEAGAYKADVRTSCVREAETGQVRCWEVVEIESDRARLQAVAGAIRSLLVDSVPVVAIDFRPYQTTPDFDNVTQDLADFLFVNAEVVPAGTVVPTFLTLRWFRTLPLRELIGEVVGCAISRSPDVRVRRILFQLHAERDQFDDLISGWMLGRLQVRSIQQVSQRQVDVMYDGATLSLCWENSSDSMSCMTILFSDGTVAAVTLSGSGSDLRFEARVASIRTSRLLADYPFSVYVLQTLQDRIEFEECQAALEQMKQIKAVLGATAVS